VSAPHTTASPRRPRSSRRKTIAFVVYPGVTLLELDASLGFLRGLMVRGYETRTVGASTDPILTDTRLRIRASAAFADVPSADVVVVPGASGLPALATLADASLLHAITNLAATASITVSIGTGSLLLAAAGLLRGRTAATHRSYAAVLAALGAQPTDERWHDDGDVVTAAGGSGALDVALHLLARLGSRGQSRLVQLFGEYDPEPPFGGLEASADDDAPLRATLRAHANELAAIFAAHTGPHEALWPLVDRARAIAAPEGVPA
jgi:transcriptional regulator GlxA family with amidase domain